MAEVWYVSVLVSHTIVKEEEITEMLNNEIKNTFSQVSAAVGFYSALRPSPNDKPAIFPNELTEIVLRALMHPDLG